MLRVSSIRITVSQDAARKHCKKVHKQAWAGSGSVWVESVKTQTFFRSGGLQKYFIVELDVLGNEEDATVEHIVQQQLTEYKSTQQIVEQELKILGEAAKTDKTGWFKRTGWLEHFKDRNLAHLSHQTRLPNHGETELKLVAELTERLIEKGVRGLSTLSREARRWLRSAQQTVIDPRPFARLQNPDSQSVYASYVVKFVCYYLRILLDEGERIEREQQEQNGVVDSESSGESSWEGDSNEEETGEDNSEDSASTRPQRRPRNKLQTDMMKDAREQFPWEEEQKVLAAKLWSTLDSGDRPAQMEALLASLSSFIFTAYDNEPLSCGLIQFLAVLGIDSETGRLRTAKNYSYMLAGMVYCVRVLGAEKLLPSQERSQQTADHRDNFLAMRIKYMADGTFSPMSEMISLLAYGQHIGINAGNSGNAYWSEDKTIFYLNGRPIVIDRFCQMAQDLVAEATAMLWKLCWVEDAGERFAVDLEKIVDDVTFTHTGKSFVDTASNRLSNGLTWMLTRALTTEGGRQLKRANGQWNIRAVQRYMLALDRFLEILLCSVHVTSGQPARGSEITTLRHRNGVLQDRNIFVTGGDVMTVARYHKSQSQWNKPKIIPRFLPPELAQVMVVFLVYVQPFQEYLILHVLGGSYSDYVWYDAQGAWETGRLTRILKRETKKRLGVELHTLDYRHAAVGIGRVKVSESFSKGYQDELGEEEEAEVDDDGEDVMELQNSRTTSMGVGNYSVPLDIVKHLSVLSIDAFRPLSKAWHVFLGVDGKGGAHKRPATVPGSARKRHLHGSISELVRLPKSKEVRVGNTREEEIHTALQQVLKERDVAFRSVEQEQATHAVRRGQTPLVVVLPTGGGKSLLFTVPAVVEKEGVTVVVVPYRALIEDLVLRIQESGVDCMEWKHGESNLGSVVVVSADLAGNITSNGNFMGYAGLLQTKGLLRRVVVDECHLIFTLSDWRPKLALLKNLRLLACPIVLLTATLPPVREMELEAGMLVHNAKYVRASTVRPNTRYFVSWCQPGKLMETAIQVCRRRQTQLLKEGQKGVVYCRSKRQCEDLAEALGCAYYHAGVPDRAERLQVWLQGGGIIVATSALGTGVDFPGIVYILHVGMPWSMIDYAQESGRGGRSGETVDAVVLVELGEVERGMEQKSEDIDVQAMGLFLIGNGCRRQLMSRYLDTNAVSCQDIESAGCNRCGEGVQKWVDEQESTGAEWNIVERMLDELRQGCAICCMLGEAGSEEWKRHKVMQCLGIEGVDGQQVDRFRQMMRDGGGTHSCRRCWVSQKYCRTGRTGYTVGVPVAERSSTVGASGGRVRSRGYDDQGVWV